MLGARMARELRLLELESAPGCSAWPVSESSTTELEASIVGPNDTPYEHGVFKLHIQIPPRYPFEPPKVRFVTKIYHCNIDSGGRICLDTLRMPPKGSWTPSINISTLLSTIRLLLSQPNADDGLDADISEHYKRDLNGYLLKARQWTQEFAREQQTPLDTSSQPLQQERRQQQDTDTDTDSESDSETQPQQQHSKRSKEPMLQNDNRKRPRCDR